MKNKAENIDALIREALSEEDRAHFDVDEPTLSEQVFSLFRGRWRWMNALIVFFMFALFVVALLAGIRFFESDDVPTMLRWGAIAWLCWFAVGFLKLWTWMEMERFVIVREIKRLELQVANLSARLREGE
jgi:hypothetical protein